MALKEVSLRKDRTRVEEYISGACLLAVRVIEVNNAVHNCGENSQLSMTRLPEVPSLGQRRGKQTVYPTMRMRLYARG